MAIFVENGLSEYFVKKSFQKKKKKIDPDLTYNHTYTYTHTHTYIYIYIYINYVMYYDYAFVIWCIFLTGFYLSMKS